MPHVHDVGKITVAPGKASVVPQGSNSLRAADSYEFDPRSGEITGFYLWIRRLVKKSPKKHHN